MGVGNRGFKTCPRFSNCYTTTRKSKLTDPHEIIDAIVFHGVGLNVTEIQMLKDKRHSLSKVNQGITPLFVLFMLVSTLMYAFIYKVHDIWVIRNRGKC